MIEPDGSKFDLGLGDPKMEHRDITSAIPVEVGPPGYTVCDSHQTRNTASLTEHSKSMGPEALDSSQCVEKRVSSSCLDDILR